MKRANIRLCVTGSRGKSGVVRLLHRALCACGLNCRARVTGVVPRDLGPEGETPILRHAGAHVAEMKWWLAQLADDTDAVVMENSAVSPDLQTLCPQLLKPTYTILTNVRLDHSSMWGTTEESVIRAISGGLPHGGNVILPEAITDKAPLLYEAEKRALSLIPVKEDGSLPYPWSINIPLALEACTRHGLDREMALAAMKSLPPDIADSQVIAVGGGMLAFAFSVNDTESTEEYFLSLGWKREETTLIYNHRGDRMDRLTSFAPWFSLEWRTKSIIGDKPFACGLSRYYTKTEDIGALASLIEKSGLAFGCGNAVYGLPLRLKLAIESGKIKL